MRLLLLSYAFPPMLAPRSIQLGRLVKYLTRMGVFVHVVAAEPSCTVETVDFSLLEPHLSKAPLFTITRTKSLESRPLFWGLRALHPALLWFPDPKIGWYPFALKALSSILTQERFDAILTCGLPYTSLLLGLKLKERFGLPWLVHLSDPWSINPYVRFLGKRHQSFIQGLEKKVFQACDGALFVSRTTLGDYLGLYPNLEDKSFHLPHSLDPEEFKQEEKAEERLFVQVGNFYGLRSPKSFFEALRGLDISHIKGVKFIFAGRVSHKDQRLARGLEGMVEFLGPIPYKEAVSLLKRAEVLLLLDAPSKTKSPFFPSKLTDYLTAGRPILGITPKEGEAERILKELGQATKDPEDIAGIKDLISQAVRGGLAPPDRGEVLKRYSAEGLAQRLMEIIERITTP